jgi:hypothetical protein
VCVCFVCVRERERTTVGEKEKSRGLFTISPERKRIIHINPIPTAHKSTQIENKMIHKYVFINKNSYISAPLTRHV